MPALYGIAAELALTAICIVAALSAWLLRGRGAAEKRPLRLRPWLVACDGLALGALVVGAVVYGNHLGDNDTSAAALGPQPALRSSHVTHAR